MATTYTSHAEKVLGSILRDSSTKFRFSRIFDHRTDDLEIVRTNPYQL